jgi:hypothetical protein
MFTDATTMRVMADRYRRLADTETDPNERRKFMDYVSVYSDMAARLEVQAAIWESGTASNADPRKKQH